MIDPQNAMLPVDSIAQLVSNTPTSQRSGFEFPFKPEIFSPFSLYGLNSAQSCTHLFQSAVLIHEIHVSIYIYSVDFVILQWHAAIFLVPFHVSLLLLKVHPFNKKKDL